MPQSFPSLLTHLCEQVLLPLQVATLVVQSFPQQPDILTFCEALACELNEPSREALLSALPLAQLRAQVCLQRVCRQPRAAYVVVTACLLSVHHTAGAVACELNKPSREGWGCSACLCRLCPDCEAV